MAASFPTSLKSFTNLTSNTEMDDSGVEGDTVINAIQDEVAAIQTKVGVNSSAVSASIDYKLTNASSSNPGHKHTLAQGATDVTASAAEVNVLDGIPATLTYTELGYVDGVTSAIQTQMDAKAPLASPTFTGTVTLPVALSGIAKLTSGVVSAVTAPSGTIVGTTDTQTLTNKRVTRRVVTVTQHATPTINTDNTDVAYITGLAQAITSMTTNLSGTPVNGDSLIISITDDGTGRAITWGASFESSGNVTLPATTVASTRIDIGFLYNTVTSKWRCVAVA